jgi:hypothetical protein
VSTSILEDACLYPHPLSPSICAGDRRGGVESIADNDVVNLPEFAAMAAGVPMITRCDHSAEKGVGGRSPRQQRALPSAGMLATFGSKRCHARIQASLIACSWVAEYRLGGKSIGDSSVDSSSAGRGGSCSGSRGHRSGCPAEHRRLNDCDVDKFKRAFHEDAWIFFTHRERTLYKGLIADSFEEWATPPAQRIVRTVLSVTQAGDIASVLLGFDNADDLSDGWVDLHTLLRTDGAWKIMNKTATHYSRAAWAAPTVSAEHEAQA